MVENARLLFPLGFLFAIIISNQSHFNKVQDIGIPNSQQQMIDLNHVVIKKDAGFIPRLLLFEKNGEFIGMVKPIKIPWWMYPFCMFNESILELFLFVFCPKYRRKVLSEEIAIDLKEILYEIAEEKEVKIKTIEVMPDHVHLFIELDPRLLLHKIIKDFKGRSSRILRDKYPRLKSRLPSLWTRSYFCCTVGHISEETVTKYIENQKNV